MFLDQIAQTLNSKGKCIFVFYGDSTTSADWIHPNYRDSLEYVIKRELAKKIEDWKLPSWKLRFINSGFDGARTTDFLELLNAQVFSYEPDVVLFMATSNDQFSDITPTQHQENIKQVLDKLVEKVPTVIYCTDICSGDDAYNTRYAEYVDAVRSLFPYKEVVFIDLLTEMKLANPARFFTLIGEGNEDAKIKPGEIDFTHPNQLDNAYITRIVLDKAFNLNFDPEVYFKETTPQNSMAPKY